MKCFEAFHVHEQPALFAIMLHPFFTMLLRMSAIAQDTITAVVGAI
jgi:hypothetical protein